MFEAFTIIYVAFVPLMALMFHLLMIVAKDFWKRPVTNFLKYLVISVSISTNSEFLVIAMVRGYLDKITRKLASLQVCRA